ncbi:glyoxylate/hydroxypyruvate reductase HPR3-like protein [Tanacetum coccineum]
MSISKTFCVSDIYEFHSEDVNEGKHSRTSSSKERGNDEDKIQELAEECMDHLERSKSKGIARSNVTAKHKISVTNIGDVFSDDVADAADAAVGRFIDVMRRITAVRRQESWNCWACEHWIKSCHKTRFHGLHCLIHIKATKILHPFTFYPNVLHLASRCDALIVCCVLTNDTRHMFDNTVIKAPGKHGVIVNVAHGAIIDEVELMKCLVEGEIGGDGLDVFENEPNVPKELFGLDNVVPFPHKTAFTTESFHDAAQVLISNLEAFFTNKPLLTLVSSEF